MGRERGAYFQSKAASQRDREAEGVEQHLLYTRLATKPPVQRKVAVLVVTNNRQTFTERLADIMCNGALRRGVRYLRSGANRYMFMPERNVDGIGDIERFAGALVATKIRNFWICMDSADTETHEVIRGLPGVMEGIRKALPAFHAHGIYPAVNLGINRNITGVPIPPAGGSPLLFP